LIEDCPLGEQQEENMDVDPYTTFVYGIRSSYTKESYLRRLRGFFNAINLDKDNTLGERCNIFVHNGRADPNWAFNNIIRFLHYQKERVGKKEITAGTLHNYVKTLKMFCEITDIAIPWKKITRGLPRGRRYADDRSPTIEEIHKIIEYPDRRIRPLVTSSGTFSYDFAPDRHNRMSYFDCDPMGFTPMQIDKMREALRSKAQEGLSIIER
jgi:hypothetical protein